MIRDSLAELIHASHVDILKKVGSSFLRKNHEIDVTKLIGILDLDVLRNVGTIVNETVSAPPGNGSRILH